MATAFSLWRAGTATNLQSIASHVSCSCRRQEGPACSGDVRGFLSASEGSSLLTSGAFQRQGLLWQRARRQEAAGRLLVDCRVGGGGGGATRPAPNRPLRLRPGGGGNRGRKEEDRDDGPLLNNMITAPQVRLLDENQTMLGVVALEDAQQRASDAELDLVMISPDASPPVVRIVDYSKYRYEQQKKKREAQKKAAANRSEVKELKMRYNIDSHDYDVRLRAAQRFLKDGDKVKITLQFRGREMEFKDLALKLFDKFATELGEDAVMETKVAMEGRSMMMVLAPNRIAVAKAQAKRDQEEARRKKKERNRKREEDVVEEEFDESEGEETLGEEEEELSDDGDEVLESMEDRKPKSILAPHGAGDERGAHLSVQPGESDEEVEVFKLVPKTGTSQITSSREPESVG